MIKIIGIFALVISSSLIGITASEKLKNRVSELNLIKYMLEEIAILIRYKAMTVYEIIGTLKKNEGFKKLEFIDGFTINMQNSFATSWGENIDKAKSSLTKADIELLKSFGGTLGTSDIDGQLSTIEVFKGNFSKLEKDARHIYEQKSRLYRSLGVLIGAFISIMLI